MEKSACAGEVTDMKCMNVAKQNAKQSCNLYQYELSCSSHPALGTGASFQRREKLRSSFNDKLDFLVSLLLWLKNRLHALSSPDSTQILLFLSGTSASVLQKLTLNELNLILKVFLKPFKKSYAMPAG